MSDPITPAAFSEEPLPDFVATIVSPWETGTGFLISPQYLVTCAHVAIGEDCEEDQVLSGEDTVEVYFAGDLHRSHLANVIAKWPLDVALLRLCQPAAQKPVALITNVLEGHKRAITERRAFVAGFPEPAPEPLKKSPITGIWASSSTFLTGQLSDVQIKGGLADGMSGSPLLVPVSGGSACLGMLFQGGLDVGFSAVILSDDILSMVRGRGVDPLTLDASTCLGPPEAAPGEDLSGLGRDHQLRFRRYGGFAGRLKAGAQPISLASVYVHRARQENEIMGFLASQIQRQAGTWVSVEGQAGAGKTSLLWYLHDSIGQDRRLLVQPFAAQHMSQDCSAEMGLIRGHLARTPAKTCVVIIDTLDLIVGRGDTYLASFLAWLKTQPVFCLTTCRTLEASRLASLEPPDHIVPLGRYTPLEAEDAICRYIDMAYRDLAPTQRAGQRKDLENLMDGRRSVQFLSTDPLVLRMMFEAYPPDPIPPDINTSLIYRTYWEKCVVRDRLKPADPRAERLREAVASRLAHAILFRQSPVFDDAILEADFGTAWKAFDDGPLPGYTLDALLSSGVIEPAGGLGGIRFFHQTLLEFAAARFILQSTQDVRRTCLERIRVDLQQGVFFRSPVLVQMAVQDANAGGRIWNDVLGLLLEAGSEAACHLSLEILGKISESEFSFSILRAWRDRFPGRLAECAIAAVGNYPKARIPFGLSVLDAVLRTEATNQAFALCEQRFAPLDPVGVLDFLERNLAFVKDHALADDDTRGHFKQTLLACLDAGQPAALSLLARVFSDFKEGQKQGCLANLAERVTAESAEATGAFLRTLTPLLYHPGASDWVEGFLALLFRLHHVIPGMAQTIARETLESGRPPRPVDHARLRGGIEGRVLRPAAAVPNALRDIVAADHLKRLTAAAVLDYSEPAGHAAILDAFLSWDLPALGESVRSSLLEVAGNIGRAHPRKLLHIVNACPWPKSGAGSAWRKIADCLAVGLPQEFKAWLLSHLQGDQPLGRRIAVGIAQLLKTAPALFSASEIAFIFDCVLKADLYCRGDLAECTGAIACVEPQSAARILRELTKRRHCEVWATLAYSLRDCMTINPDWVLQQLPHLLKTALTRPGSGLFPKILEALRFWPGDQYPSLLSFMEDNLTATYLAAFPQEICQVEFLMLVQMVAHASPSRAFGLLQRALVTTDGSAGASAVAAANIAAQERDEGILADALDHLLQVAPRGSQRSARNALQRGLRAIDDKLGRRRVIDRFFAVYPEVTDPSALRVLIRAVSILPSWRVQDKEALLRDTRHITGEIRSQVMALH